MLEAAAEKQEDIQVFELDESDEENEAAKPPVSLLITFIILILFSHMLRNPRKMQSYQTSGRPPHQPLKLAPAHPRLPQPLMRPLALHSSL